MKEARLSNFTLLSIERDTVIDKDEVAKSFERMKERMTVIHITVCSSGIKLVVFKRAGVF